MNEKFNQENQSLDEQSAPPNIPPPDDWGMTNPLKNPIKEVDRDGWKMPEPIFRATEGYCPVTSEKAAVFTAPKTQPAPAADEKLSNLYAPPSNEGMPDLTMHNISLADLKVSIPPETPSPDAAIEPQPDISEEFGAEDADAKTGVDDEAASVKKRFIFTVFGITAMLVFAAAFLALVYVLFFTDYLSR